MVRFILITTLAMGFATAEVAVPKGATEVEPGVYRHADASGKVFVYRKTPFGIVKSPEQAAKPQAADTQGNAGAATGPTASPFGDVKKNSKTQDIKVVERGDILEFERPSPFGSYRWKNNKNQLTPEESEAWAKSRGRQPGKSAAGPKE